MYIYNYNYVHGHIVFKNLCKHMNQMLFNSDFLPLWRNYFQSVKKAVENNKRVVKMPYRTSCQNIPVTIALEKFQKS